MPMEAVIAAPERYSPSNPAGLRLQTGLTVMRAWELQDAGAGEQ